MTLSKYNLTRRRLIKAAGGLAALGGISVFPPTALAKGVQTAKPDRLRAGATVGLVTPASNVPENEDLLAAMDLVRSSVLKRRPRQICADANSNGSDQQRADDLNGSCVTKSTRFLCARWIWLRTTTERPDYRLSQQPKDPNKQRYNGYFECNPR